ncbi:MAG: hypothetical protein AAGD11_07055 [Planctomycetota bacterium]
MPIAQTFTSKSLTAIGGIDASCVLQEKNKNVAKRRRCKTTDAQKSEENIRAATPRTEVGVGRRPNCGLVVEGP